MSWVTVVWSMTAAACLLLAFEHGVVWWWRRESRASLLFVVTSVATMFFSVGEVGMMRAQTPEQFAWIARWIHVPVWALLIALVWFIRVYLRAGRLWLA